MLIRFIIRGSHSHAFIFLASLHCRGSRNYREELTVRQPSMRLCPTRWVVLRPVASWRRPPHGSTRCITRPVPLGTMSSPVLLKMPPGGLSKIVSPVCLVVTMTLPTHLWNERLWVILFKLGRGLGLNQVKVKVCGQVQAWLRGDDSPAVHYP